MTVVVESSSVKDSGSPVRLRKKVQNLVAAVGITTPARTVGWQVGIDFACALVEDMPTTRHAVTRPAPICVFTAGKPDTLRPA
jgi:hypothetical protein